MRLTTLVAELHHCRQISSFCRRCRSSVPQRTGRSPTPG